MDWIVELVSEFARWGSLALLACGAALCLKETLAQGGHQAETPGPADARAAPAPSANIEVPAPGAQRAH
jgi:hypothetical protein